MAGKLAGKVAVVTGASKGIGAAIAVRLAAEGAEVVVSYASNQEAAGRVVASIEKAGGKAVAAKADVSKQADVDRLFAETKKAFGRLDILVNNAGIYEFAPLEAITEDHFHSQFNLNVLGLILASQKAAAEFGDEGGCIINISSLVSVSPMPNVSIYSATKGAVDAVTKSLAKELGPKKIRVNSINPGLIETEGTQEAGILGGEMHEMIVKQTPLGRIGKPEEIASVAAFFASDEARWVTGTVLPVTGGMT